MAKGMTFEDVKKFLLKEKKKMEKAELSEKMKDAAATAKLAKMKDFSLYSDDEFDAESELGLTPTYNEGGWDSNWN